MSRGLRSKSKLIINKGEKCINKRMRIPSQVAKVDKWHKCAKEGQKQ